jgi:hypothetical protein
MTPATIRALWRSGLVNRWHCNPEPRLRNSHDTTAGHQARVADLMAVLFPDCGEAMILAALRHDAPECVTGDMPRGCGIKPQIKAAELAWYARMGLPPPPDDPRLRLCDSLDAWLWCQLCAPDLLDDAEWQDHRAEIVALAWRLGVGGQVEGVMGR